MSAITVYNERCPFCNKQLRKRIVYCPKHINLECLECTTCKSYFYTNKNYNVLKSLAIDKNRNLNKNVYKINSISKNKTTKKNNNKKKVLKGKYDCIYQVNNNCYHIDHNKVCTGNLLCSSYTRNNPNQLDVSIISSYSGIYFLLTIFNVNYRCFMKVGNKYVYKFQNNKYQKMDIYIYLEFENYEQYINFLFFGLKNTVIKINNKIIIKIENPNEIKSILNKPYREINNKITISKQITTEYAKLYFRITISKQQLFDLTSKTVKQNNKNNKINNQDNIAKTTKVNQITLSQLIKKIYQMI